MYNVTIYIHIQVSLKSTSMWHQVIGKVLTVTIKK